MTPIDTLCGLGLADPRGAQAMQPDEALDGFVAVGGSGRWTVDGGWRMADGRRSLGCGVETGKSMLRLANDLGCDARTERLVGREVW